MKEIKRSVKKLSFGKRSHVPIIKAIAEGLRSSGQLSVYLELGTAKGACFNEVAPLAGVAHAVDHDPEKYEYIYKNKNLKWHACTTDYFFKEYSGDPFDLVFVDAGHDFESSWSDFQKVAPLVNPNGIILLHDTYPPNEDFLRPDLSGDTWKTAWKIRQELSDEYEIATLPCYFGISIIRKCRKQLAWAEEAK
jgi:predicted O-methyltransferase YrrM